MAYSGRARKINSRQIGQLRRDTKKLLTDIPALEGKVADLAVIVRELFELCSGVQRTSDAQANASKVISERLDRAAPSMVRSF
jgi:hypothetical protein